ncbi:hypothetical protein [Streptomyces sp. NRRL S-87]|uniref:hypothetical protein n=1 Tax=Streptomyces sp. NRRL S-87 TaxID=1463920 RepID=UPI0004BF783F|nr:hypothetical protein [Streptomyces sp. NRRL S-87]
MQPLADGSETYVVRIFDNVTKLYAGGEIDNISEVGKVKRCPKNFNSVLDCEVKLLQMQDERIIFANTELLNASGPRKVEKKMDALIRNFCSCAVSEMDRPKRC